MRSIFVCTLLALAPLAAETRWYKVEPDPVSFAGTALDLSRFVEAPSGKHGFVQARNGHFVFEDGTPVRFFGAPVDPFEADEIVPAVRRMPESFDPQWTPITELKVRKGL